ncbi:hypothetical protein Tco_1473959 [Tanacetum coccineum]
MAAPNPNGTHTTPCPTNPNHAKAKTNGDTKIEISTELIMMVRNNAFNGAETNDAVDHITRFLQIIDLVKTPNVNIEQLCVLTFPYSLTGEAHRWWVHEGNSKITSWVEIVDKFFYKYYPLSRASKSNDANVRECHLKFMNWLSSKFKNPWKLSSATKNALWNFWEKGYDNITLFDDGESSDDDCDKSNLINHHDTSPFLDPYQAAKNEGIQRHHMKCNDNNSGTENFIQNDAPHSGNNNQGNEGICRVDKFEVIKYSIGDNKEFMGIRTLERDSWDQTVNGVSSIYLDIFRKKDEGWTVHRTK